jgi:Galactose oxidase, central domain
MKTSMYQPIELQNATTQLMKEQPMRLSVRLFALMLLAVCGSIPLSAQQPPAFTLSPATRHVLPRLPGAVAADSDAAQTLISPVATPNWSSNFRFTHDTGLEAHSAVYDGATSTMIVFAGLSINGYADTNAVLLYAPANGDGLWSTLIANGTFGSPAARDSHTAVYDSANNRMIIFGGEDFSSGVPMNDVWVLSNANGQGGTATWTQLSPSGTLPGARELHTAVYDPATNVMTVFGGFGSTGLGLSDVWVLSHANGLGGTPAWTRLSPGGVSPIGLGGSTAVYDSNNNIMTVFAGVNHAVTASTNGVWTLSHANGVGGTPQWTNIVANGAAGSPAKRESPIAVYDVANNRMIIFGGGPLSGGAFNDVWVLSHANGLGGTPAWTKLRPTSVLPNDFPGTRFFHTAVYDATTNQMMVFGGNNDEGVFFVTWVLSDANGL